MTFLLSSPLQKSIDKIKFEIDGIVQKNFSLWNDLKIVCELKGNLNVTLNSLLGMT